MTKLNILANVEGLGKIVESCKDFYDELLELRGAGAEIITPRDEAYTRIKTEGKENIGKSEGTRTSVGFEYVKKERPILKLNSRLLTLKLARQAVESNRQGNYFHTKTTSEYDKSLEQAKKQENKEPSKRSVIVLPSRDNFEITPIKNWYVLESLLGDQAKPYWDLHKKIKGDVPITCYLVDKNIVKSQNGTILTQLWFRGLGGGSGLYGCGRVLDDVGRARGVLKTGEASSPKFSEKLPYTNKQIDKIANIIRDVKDGKKGTLSLEKVLKSLEDLKIRL